MYCGQPLRPRELLERLPHPALPIFGRDCPARARPWQAYPAHFSQGPKLPAYLNRPIFILKLPSINALETAGPSQRPILSPSPPRYISWTLKRKHPIRKDVDDMRCTPRETASKW